MLKLEINNKVFTGESLENNKIKILLNENLDDINYFINTTDNKQININFTTNFKKGTLKFCSYRLSFDEKYVIIYYEDVKIDETIEVIIDDNQTKLNRILNEAVSVIYFNDNSDYIRTLYNIVGIIAGEENQNYESCRRMFKELNNEE